MTTYSDILKKLNKSIADLLFDSYSLFFLSRNIEFLIDLHSRDNLTGIQERIILFDILIKYSQLIESFAAHITASEKSNKGKPSARVVCNHLVCYKVSSVLKDYSIFNTNPGDPLPQIKDEFEERNRYAFGLNHIDEKDQVERNIDVIFSTLIPIFHVYYFHEYVYNANKHGHRIFHLYNLDDNENEPVLYLDKMSKNQKDYEPVEGHDRFLIDYITVSRSIIDKQVLPNIQKFNRLYKMLLENNKFIIKNEWNKIKTIEEF